MTSRSAAAGALLLLSSCTYAAPEPLVRVEHHVLRAGTDSLVAAVSAALIRRPTGLAAFPDGGRPRLDDEQGLFYLCVAAPAGPPSVRRIASIPRPDSIRSQFVPWVTSWDGAESVIASVSGYVAAESRPAAFRRVWFRLRLTGETTPLGAGARATGAASSLPAACESAIVADATRLLLERAATRRR